MSRSMDADRVQLLPRPDTRPMQNFGTGNDHWSQNNLAKQVSFDPYDHAIFLHETHGQKHHDPDQVLPTTSTRLDLRTTVLMCCLLLLGIGCAIAHHAFNSYLDDKSTNAFDQAWAIRIGTALSMAFKTAVLASMGMAFSQRMWFSVRRKAMSVKSLDALFGAFGGDPRSLFQGDLYRSARLALLIAVSSWLLPIATVFTPATLRVKLVDRSSSADCLVPSVNLNNVTDGGTIRYPSTSGLYSGPAPMTQRLAVQSLITGSFNGFPYASGSPAGANTSYTLSFTAPALQCSPNNNTVQPSLAPNTYWTCTRSLIHDSNSGHDVPTLQIQYASSPGVSNALSCVPYIANYGVLVTYNSTAQSIALLNLTMTATAGRPIGGTIQLSENNALATGSASIVDAVFNALVGNLTRDPSGNGTTMTSTVALASFVHMSNLSAYTFQSVPESVQQLMRDVSTSLMGLRLAETQTTCTMVNRVNIYIYDQGVLLASYLAVIALALAVVAVGLHALKKNGHSGDTSFSGVVLSTRNPTLDRACEGGRERLLALRVKFGRLRSTGRPAFGTASDFVR
ncbi:hypothetical protein FRC08_012376 [Ceratobasidium sp. 394]|nr:hypothetical protein FRC08_012376 [Ceratobasidium sp. 394]